MALSILIIDDSPVIHTIIENMLANVQTVCIKPKVTHAYNGVEGLEAIKTHAPDLIFLDLQMPVMDGIEFIESVAWETNPPSIVLISSATPKILNSAYILAAQFGIDIIDVMPKPFSQTNFDTVIHKFLSLESAPAKRDVIKLSAAEIETGLSQGKNLTVYYQPKVDLKTGGLVAVEALARWAHPQHGILSPISFLAQLEDAHLSRLFTSKVMEQSFLALQSFKAIGIDIKLSMNITVDDLLEGNFVTDVLNCLHEHDLQSTDIIIEVLEDKIMNDLRRPLSQLTRIAMKGFHISIDDFGIGASSMDRLRNLPCNEVKIDRSFISNIDRDQEKHTMVSSMIDMAHKLGMTVVAEGVETLEELTVIDKLGCDQVQGYLISKPLSFGELARFTHTEGWMGMFEQSSIGALRK